MIFVDENHFANNLICYESLIWCELIDPNADW